MFLNSHLLNYQWIIHYWLTIIVYKPYGMVHTQFCYHRKLIILICPKWLISPQYTNAVSFAQRQAIELALKFAHQGGKLRLKKWCDTRAWTTIRFSERMFTVVRARIVRLCATMTWPYPDISYNYFAVPCVGVKHEF